MEQAISAALVLTPFVMGLVELAKRSGLGDRLAPVASLVSGFLLALLVAWADAVDEVDFDRPGMVVLTGLVSGMSAAGVYSGVRAVKNG